MFCFLSKKISIPNQIKLHSIAWNWEAGWIACGGENGLLKMLLLDHGPNSQKIYGGTNLSVNQPLEGHEKERGTVRMMAWSHTAEKVTTADDKGTIIVWHIHRGVWTQEMISQRKETFVRDIAWNHDGTKVGIIYDDGGIIVGNVEGARLWARELKRPMRRCTWSPDGRYLLFGAANGEVLINDATTGQNLSKVNIRCVDDSQDNELAGLMWHPGSPAHCGESVGALAIVYANGKGQIMRNEHDDRPHLISTGLTVANVSWNPQGTILAVGGTSSADPNHVMLRFFSCHGKSLRSLRFPGKQFGALTWEGSGLRMALAVDSCIYFANIRPDYRWTFFGNTAVYLYTKRERNDHSIMFWNTKTNEKNIKNVRKVKQIKSSGDTCAIVSQAEDSPIQHIIALNNEVGTPFSTKYVEIEPSFCAMNSYAVALASEEYICVWQYRSPTAVIDALDPLSVVQSRRDSAVERVFHVDDLVTKDSMQGTVNTRKVGVTNDLICSIFCNEKYLVVGRESGIVQLYTLNPVTLVAKHKLLSPPQMIEMNCDNTMLGVIDNSSILNMYRVVEDKFSVVTNDMEVVKGFERKDVWSIIFAVDNPDMFAIMEKMRMFIFRGMDPEEPVLSSAHPCRFEALKMRAFNLDETLHEPEHPAKSANIEFETKSLRDTRTLLRDVGFKDAVQYVEDHPHPRLWSFIAEAALEELDFVVAEKAVSRCREYPAIQFVKRIKQLDDPNKQKAEVLAYYHRFDEAEKVYKEMDRRDLAVEMRARLGDWFRVVQLVQEGLATDDSMIQTAWENIGDYYADRQKWSKAAEYYSLCRNYEKLAQVHYVRDDFRALERLVEEASHDKPFLVTLGDKFLSVGLIESAVNAFLAAGEVRMAIDCCVELHHWDKAVALADKYKVSDIGKYLTKYAHHLVEKNKIPQAIELNRKAGQNNEAAKLLSRLGQQAAAQQLPLKAKKFYVLAALEIETYRRRQVRAETKTAAEVADELLAADKAMAEDRSLDSAWRGAEAYHFFMLCQQYLYANNVEAGLIVAMRLMEYDDIIAPRDSYSLIALCSYYAKNFGICSKAMTRLEQLEQEEEDRADAQGVSAAVASLMEFDMNLDVTQTSVAGAMGQLHNKSSGGSAIAAGASAARVDKPKPFSMLAVQIFTRHMPVDTSVDRVRCAKCGAYNKDWASVCTSCSSPFGVCLVTGRAIPQFSGWQCLTCHHRAIETEMLANPRDGDARHHNAFRFNNCPLCHTPI